MMLVLTEDQEMLGESVAQVVATEAPVGRFRQMRDDGLTRDDALWQQFIELGWPGVATMELADVAVIMEALGKNLVVSPMISSVMASFLGEEVDEGQVFALALTGVTVDDGRLTGHSEGVLDGSAAQAFLVATSDGVYKVAAADAEVTPLVRVDFRDAANVRFEGAPGDKIAEIAQLEGALDAGRVALCAEMLGGMQAALELTLGYLKERHQFGVPIGSFQVLQHRAVDCFMEVELSRSAVMAAAREPTPALVSLAKARCSDAYIHITHEAIQLHGGIGMTDEHDIGFYLKRAMVSAQVLGNAAWHRDRWARLRGY